MKLSSIMLFIAWILMSLGLLVVEIFIFGLKFFEQSTLSFFFSGVIIGMLSALICVYFRKKME